MPEPSGEVQNIAAEQYCLGCLLLRDTAYYTVSNELADADFYDPRHKLIYKTIGKIAQAETGHFNIVTVKNYLAKSESGTLVSEEYLETLTDVVADAGEAGRYAKVVVECARRRAAIAALRAGIDILSNPIPGVALGETVDDIASELVDAARADAVSCQTIGAYAVAALRKITQSSKEQKRFNSFSWPLTAIENTCGPALPGDCITLAGRSGWGKSTLALQIGKHWSKEHGPGAMFSLEMRGVEHAQRAMAQDARVPSWRITRNEVASEVDKDALADAADRLDALPIWIEERPRLTLEQIRSRAIGLKRKHGIRWLILDHAHLVKVSSKDSRFEATYDLLSELKALAKELNVVSLVLAQVNKEGRQRKTDRPMAGDINYYSAFEQSSDTIFFIYRPEVGIAENQPPETDEVAYTNWRTLLAKNKGTAEIINAKARSGPAMKSSLLRFNGELMMFENGPEPKLVEYQDTLEAI